MQEQINTWRHLLLNGDNTPLEIMMQEYGHHCMDYLVRYKRASKEEAEDIFFEALLDLREQLIKGKEITSENLKGYLKGICRNKWLKYIHRKTKQRDKQTDVIRYFYAYRYPEGMTDMEKAEKAADKQLLIENVMTAYQSLQENCRKILHLTIVEDCSGKEVAELLELKNANVVKTLKSRCMKKWWKALRR